MMHKSIATFSLKGAPDDYGFAEYVHPDTEEAKATRRLYLSTEVYRDMGSPDKITVTIEPGDQLNEGKDSSNVT